MVKRQIINSLLCSVLMVFGPAMLSPDWELPKNFVPVNNFAMAETNNDLAETLKAVKEKVAPDLRITIFDITTEKSANVIRVRGRVMEQNQRDELVKALSKLGAVKDEIDVFPFEHNGELAYGVANLPVLNVRDNPRHSSQLITQGLLGRGMKILGRKDDWLYISLDTDNYVGWVKVSDVWRTDKKNYDNWNNYNKIMLTGTSVDLLNSPDKTDKSGIKLYMTTVLNLAEEMVDYYKVVMPQGNKHYSGKYFYIPKESAKFVGKSITPNPSAITDIVQRSQSFISTPYLWGGTTPVMNDCSGFTQILYKLNGYLLPRDADQQQKATQPVNNIDSLQSGDLVFFPGHVGLYIGDKKFIHSSVGYGGVAVTSFDSRDPLFNEWYVTNFKGGGRVVR